MYLTTKSLTQSNWSSLELICEQRFMAGQLSIDKGGSAKGTNGAITSLGHILASRIGAYPNIKMTNPFLIYNIDTERLQEKQAAVL